MSCEPSKIHLCCYPIGIAAMCVLQQCSNSLTAVCGVHREGRAVRCTLHTSGTGTFASEAR